MCLPIPFILLQIGANRRICSRSPARTKMGKGTSSTYKRPKAVNDISTNTRHEHPWARLLLGGFLHGHVLEPFICVRGSIRLPLYGGVVLTVHLM